MAREIARYSWTLAHDPTKQLVLHNDQFPCRREKERLVCHYGEEVGYDLSHRSSWKSLCGLPGFEASMDQAGNVEEARQILIFEGSHPCRMVSVNS